MKYSDLVMQYEVTESIVHIKSIQSCEIFMEFFLMFAATNPNVRIVQAGKKGNFIRYETTLVTEKYPCFIDNFNTLKFLSFQLCIGICTQFSPSLNAKHRFETKVMLNCGVRETKQNKKSNVGHFKYKLHSAWLHVMFISATFFNWSEVTS